MAMDLLEHSENQQQRQNATLEKNESEEIENIKIVIQKLYSIWDIFGLQADQKLQRAKIVWDHVHSLLNDILGEETSFYEDIQERVHKYTEKIEELSKALSISPKEISGSLIKREEELRHELDSLTKIKSKRIKDYQDLKKEEIKLCQILELTKHQLPEIFGIPSENDIHELEQHIHQLKAEKERRHIKFCNLKKELTTILEITELAPQSCLEKDIFSEKDDLPLSNDTFVVLEKAICKAQTKKAELEISKKELLDRLLVLWQRLKVEKSKRVEFLSKHSDCRPSTLKSIEYELEKCEKMKRENIRMFVESLRQELNQLWIKCHASEYQKRFFKQYYASEMTDEVLSAFDAEVEKWKKYYKDVESILKKIDKRQHLFETMVEFESRANDPKRFKNRKGTLLKEEKQRLKWEKELPALEKELFHDIEEYQNEKGTPFLYYGEDYRAFITNQWEAREAQKENERLERQKLASELMNTPSKRPLMITPKSAPSKLLKSNDGLATPCNSNNYSRRIPNTIGKPISKNIRVVDLHQSPMLKLRIPNSHFNHSDKTHNTEKSASKGNRNENLLQYPALKSYRKLALLNNSANRSSKSTEIRKSTSKNNRNDNLQQCSASKSSGKLPLFNNSANRSKRTPNSRKSTSKSNRNNNLHQSPVLKSNGKLSILTPSNQYNRTPSTVKQISKCTKTKPLPIKDKNILKERNCLFPQINDSHNTTTYSDFIKELQVPTRCSSRISVLATKKPGGNRLVLNNSQNKKKNIRKSVTKSPRMLSEIASNLTPAKKKFTLPFLF